MHVNFCISKLNYLLTTLQCELFMRSSSAKCLSNHKICQLWAVSLVFTVLHNACPLSNRVNLVPQPSYSLGHHGCQIESTWSFHDRTGLFPIQEDSNIRSNFLNVAWNTKTLKHSSKNESISIYRQCPTI